MGTGLKLLQYGESGAGKTVRACRFAAYGPLYVFDFDGKFEPTKKFLKAKFPDLVGNIAHDTYRGADADVINRVNTKLKEIESGKSGIATVVFDSWTQWEMTYFEYLMSKFTSFGGKGWGESRATVLLSPEQKIIMPGTADHQLKNKAFAEFIDRVTSLPVNIIINCHLQVPAKGPATIAASGAIARTIPKYFHEWHYLYSSGGFWKVRVQANDDFLANTTRTDVGPSGVLDKDVLDVYSDLLYTVK
jgi:hypothetical protein